MDEGRREDIMQKINKYCQVDIALQRTKLCGAPASNMAKFSFFFKVFLKFSQFSPFPFFLRWQLLHYCVHQKDYYRMITTYFRSTWYSQHCIVFKLTTCGIFKFWSAGMADIKVNSCSSHPKLIGWVIAVVLDAMEPHFLQLFLINITCHQVVPLGAGQDVGRSCILISMGGKNIMLDCGMHMGFQDDRKFPDFSWV